VYPEDCIVLYNAYLDATQRPQSYLIFDLTLECNDGLRYWTNIFPAEYSWYVYSDIGDVACEIHLTRPSLTEYSRSEISLGLISEL